MAAADKSGPAALADMEAIEHAVTLNLKDYARAYPAPPWPRKGPPFMVL